MMVLSVESTYNRTEGILLHKIIQKFPGEPILKYHPAIFIHHPGENLVKSSTFLSYPYLHIDLSMSSTMDSASFPCTCCSLNTVVPSCYDLTSHIPPCFISNQTSSRIFIIIDRYHWWVFPLLNLIVSLPPGPIVTATTYYCQANNPTFLRLVIFILYHTSFYSHHLFTYIS